MPPREIQWLTLIGLHYDKFRVADYGIFSLYKKKVSLQWLNVWKLLYLKNGSCSVDQRNQHLLKLNFITVDTTAYSWIYPEPSK